MSHECSSNLIVGDVKQSIYRWRSGDWRLLANIKSEFGSDGRYVRELPLDMNYRSAPNIVAFNNAFFEEAASQEAVDAYGDVSQQWPEKKEATGLVSIDLLPNENYDTGTLEAVASRIGYLLEQGAHPGEIAILLRSNKLIPVVANYLTQQFPDISVVSEEAFRLEASPAVQVIVQALRYLLNPADVIAKAFLIKTFSGRLDGELPEDLQLRSEELLRQPLYNLTEHLYGLFAHNPALSRQSAYLCAFFDQVATFASDQAADAATFIAEWDESLHKKTIQSPELNGIRIISIHKSKGLEFDHVIIPFCDWRLEQHDIIWCRPQEPPYNQLPLVPIDFSQKGMKGTIYERDYEEEHRQNVVDNLNLLYVAFTRASCNLFVMGKRSSKGSRSALIESVVPALKLKGATLSADEGKNSPMHFEFGTLFLKAEKQEKDQPNPFLRKSVPVDVDIATTSHRPDFRQSNKSQTFAAGDDEQATGSTYIQLGSVLHNIFSTIRTTADIPRALRQIEQEGIIYDRTLTRSNLETMIAKRLENPRVADWFSPRWTLFNECNILSVENGTVTEHRPDRVMTDGREWIVVDFKFGRPRDEYHEQVRRYMQLLRQMGHDNISGYLWFVYSNQVIEVTPHNSF
jgi:ATP-dependent exoDNAse (exonuclease V) beta subunit